MLLHTPIAGMNSETLHWVTRYQTAHYILSPELIRQTLGWWVPLLKPWRGGKPLSMLNLAGPLKEGLPVITCGQTQAWPHVTRVKATLITPQVNETDLDVIEQDDAIFQADAPNKQNQCVFIQGYRMMLNFNTTWETRKWDNEVHPIADINPEEVSAMATMIQVVPSDSVQDDTLQSVQDHEIMIEHTPRYLEVRVKQFYPIDTLIIS